MTPAASVAHDWWAQIDGPNGYAHDYDYESSGTLADRYTWTDSHVGSGYSGRWSAMVEALSWAVLATGGVQLHRPRRLPRALVEADGQPHTHATRRPVIRHRLTLPPCPPGSQTHTHASL
ncbi:hypothetical protein [Streptomyces hokutonensis]|uniref:hypothetical protein n=1 Tax=Streptomyces hokutonensis TaxID=1306990 RepID=UPI0036BD8BCA